MKSVIFSGGARKNGTEEEKLWSLAAKGKSDSRLRLNVAEFWRWIRNSVLRWSIPEDYVGVNCALFSKETGGKFCRRKRKRTTTVLRFAVLKSVRRKIRVRGVDLEFGFKSGGQVFRFAGF